MKYEVWGFGIFESDALKTRKAYSQILKTTWLEIWKHKILIPII